MGEANTVTGEYGSLTYRSYFVPHRRGDHILAKQVCHEAKRNIESPATLSALSFGFAQTNGNHLPPCRDRRPRLSVRTVFRLRTNERLPTNFVGGDVLDAPQRCSHYLTATRRILINICRGDHILAKQVCHEAKRNNESPVSLFALSHGFNRCSLYLSASH